MDGVLADNSGITTNNFYIYSGICKIGRIYGEETIYCGFKLGNHIKATLPKELLNFFGGNVSENTYDSDNIIFLKLNIKPPILKHLTLPFCVKKTIDIFSATKEEFSGNNNYNYYTRNKEFKFLNKIITKTPINKIILIRSLKDNLPIVPSNNILNILNYYEKEENNN